MRRSRVALTALVGNDSDPRSDDIHLKAALDWIFRSQDVTGTGGSVSSYNIVLGWGDPYTETTGYIIPMVLAYAREMNQPSSRDRALQMADWLCHIQYPDGSFPKGTGTGGDPRVFNTGQIVLGLVSAYRETGDERYRWAAFDASDWLVDQQSGEGYWDQNTLDDKRHMYTTRVAWSLLTAHAIADRGRERFRTAARDNFEWVLSKQQPNGQFEDWDPSAADAHSCTGLRT